MPSVHTQYWVKPTSTWTQRVDLEVINDGEELSPTKVAQFEGGAKKPNQGGAVLDVDVEEELAYC